MSILVVLTNVPDDRIARAIAHDLVERRLAACVNILAACNSIYRWQGKLEEATEIPLLIKTRAEIYDQVEAAIKAQHPYETPEIIAFEVERGVPQYLEWITAETVIEVG